MSEPIGRDKLGRLAYRDDWFCWPGHSVDGVCNYVNIAIMRKPLSECTVNLLRSPKRTNYERYFADLGTEDEVIHAARRICTEDSLYHGLTDCEDSCPFGKWPGGDSCFSAFVEWLSDEATL